jgi:hypothetical protein
MRASQPVSSCLSALALVACAVPASAGSVSDARAAGHAAALGDFCAAAQRLVTGTTVPVANVVHDEFEAFVLSKPQVRPLESQQYHWYADAGRTQLMMISCKLKTADHISTEYGAHAAGPQRSCVDVNRATVAAVGAALQAAGEPLAFSPDAIRLPADAMTRNGPQWLEPHTMILTHVDGTLEILARSFRADWTDPAHARVPERFRGTHYCHLVAPEYLRAVLTGAAAPQGEPWRSAVESAPPQAAGEVPQSRPQG